MSRKQESIIDRFKDELEKVSVTDRLDPRWVLMRQLVAINDLFREEEFDQNIVNMAIETWVAQIPDSNRDQTFKDEIKEAYDLFKNDTRGYWCGVRVGEKPIWEIIRVPNPIKKLHACINLYDRLGSWFRKTPKTIFRGEKIESISN